MGGEGSMMAANQSLKNNRDSRRKDRRKFIGLASDTSQVTEYNLPKATNEKLVRIKQRLQLERKTRNTKIILFVGITFSILLGVFFYFI